MLKRLTAYFNGTVQGVGFRYTTQRLAGRFPVTGFVRNLSDGRVELVAEGEETKLQDFLAAIRQSQLAGYIQDTEAKWTAVTLEFKEFGVRF